MNNESLALLRHVLETFGSVNKKFCPSCRASDKQSKVHCNFTFDLSTNVRIYWDEGGDKHIHDSFAESYWCTNGHDWKELRIPCPTCGSQWLEKS